jgi:CheY-like chemotaxis protein
MQGSNCEILVVDDDDAIREVLRAVLTDDGYRVSCAANGEAALERLRSGGPAPCAILLDLMMPIMDGWTFRREQMKDPTMSQIPVIVVTAQGRDAVGDINAREVLHKPMGLLAVTQAIARVCGRPDA